MKKSRKKLPVGEEASRSEVRVPVGEVLIDVAAEFRELLVKGGLAVAAALFSAEVDQLCGPALRPRGRAGEPVGHLARRGRARRPEGSPPEAACSRQ